MGQLLAGMETNGFASQKEEVTQILSTVRRSSCSRVPCAQLRFDCVFDGVYASTYPAAYLAAILNAQPMGFYSPETLANDAKRHVKILPIDVQKSDWFCTLES